ncbi:phosphohistidine phosphatase SixA [bacterium F16]|nr:phosphohistidine phosphatase SixA [bacterium F16]
MKLFFVQHGKCLAREINESRPLSDKGKTDSERVASLLHKNGVSVSGVYHSGKLRAQQTAEIFAETLRIGNIHQLSGMEPNDDVGYLADQLEPDAMYVGHLPHIDRVVSYLVSGDSDAQVATFRNSGAACLQRTESGYHIQWLVTPEIC